jgi:outer membrane lipoprotein LolB
MNRIFARVVISSLLILLAGCSALPVAEPERVEQGRVGLAMLDAWTLEGKIAFRFEEDNYPLRFVWEYREPLQRLELQAPLGQGWWILEQLEQGVRLQSADGERHFSGDIQSVLQRITGWDIPVAMLRWWMVGLPSPYAPFQAEWNEQGVYDHFQQQGWRVEYRDYQWQGEYLVPARITATQNNTEVRVRVREWVLGQALP